jgi:hypothetical protein
MLLHTVKYASGNEAAATTSMPFGTGSTWPSSTTQYSPYPPPCSSAHTASPALNSRTALPTETTTPETSSPGQVGAPEGAG